MWLYCSGQSQEKRIILYDYRGNRKGENPKRLLEGFTGYLQTDMYPGYKNMTGVTHVGCLAHARRKFNDAVISIGEKKARVPLTRRDWTSTIKYSLWIIKPAIYTEKKEKNGVWTA